MAEQEIIGLGTWAQTDAWKTPTENHLTQLELESITYQHYREEGEKIPVLSGLVVLLTN